MTDPHVVTGPIQTVTAGARREWGVESRSRTGQWDRVEMQDWWDLEDAERHMYRWYRQELEFGGARVVSRIVGTWQVAT